ncbi:YciI family protein [Georgenia halophila]|uniref:YciI family protein n=1 Tax=Georgenia halophila TaxID=620889 RepID=A0ABP8L4V3_9MICO
MTLYAVEYVYDQSRTTDVETLRPQHREFLQALHEDGVLVASGPWQDAAAPGALLLVKGEDHDSVLHQLDRDPFHRAHLIVRRTARAWNPVIGSLS